MLGVSCIRRVSAAASNCEVGPRRLRLAVGAMTVPRWPGHPRGGSPMSAPGPDPSQQSAVSGKQLALIVYILYFVSYFTGITALIGVIIAHVQLASADALLSTHCRFQIRTFWIGLLYLAIGIVLASVIVGIAVLFCGSSGRWCATSKACWRSMKTDRLRIRARGCSDDAVAPDCRRGQRC